MNPEPADHAADALAERRFILRATFSRAARITVAAASAAIAFTLVMLVYRYPAPRMQPLGVHPMPEWHSLGLHLVSSVLLSLCLLLMYWERHGTTRRPLFALLLIWLVPAWALSSIPVVLATALGYTHPLTMAALLGIYGIPLLGAWRGAAHPRTVRENLARAVIVLLSVSATVLSLEASFRAIGYRPAEQKAPYYVGRGFRHSRIPGLGYEMMPSRRWGMKFPSNDRGYFDERNIVWYQINSAGFRGREFSLDRKPSTARIAFLGDSLGFGRGVRYEDTVTTLLEERLNRLGGCPVEVYNFSVEGYGILEKALVLEHRVLRYRPDLIILWYLLDDPQAGAAQWILRAFRQLRGYSVLAGLVAAEADRVIVHYLTLKIFRDQHRDDDARWVETVKSLRRMADLAGERGTPIYLFVHPELFSLRDYPLRDVHRKVVTTARELGFQAFDLLDALAGRDEQLLWVHPRDHHPNEQAHRIAADHVATVLSRTAAVCQSRGSHGDDPGKSGIHAEGR